MLQYADATEKTMLLNGDSINVVSSLGIEPMQIEIRGQVLYPGFYDIDIGDTILSVITKAGGMTDQAYPEASVFTRLAVAQQQKNSYGKNADNLEKSLIDSTSSGSSN